MCQHHLTYRLNFAAGVMVEVAYALIKITYFVVVMTSGASIGPLTPDMVGIFVGTYMFMTGIWMLLSGINSLPHKALHGELDALMTKPGSLQVLQTLGSFNFAMALPNCSGGTALILWSWRASGIPVTFGTVGGFLLFALMGIVLTYGFTLIPCLLVFWVSSLNGVFTLFAALWDFNNMPMMLYGQTAQLIGTFIVPIFVITNWSGLFVLGLLRPWEILWGLAAPIIVLAASKLLWTASLRRYTSANG